MKGLPTFLNAGKGSKQVFFLRLEKFQAVYKLLI